MDAEMREPGQRAYEAGGYVDWRNLPETQKARFRAIERTIYAAGFEAAKEMAARLADTAHSDPQWDHGHQIISWYGAHVARHIRALTPQEVASRPALDRTGEGEEG